MQSNSASKTNKYLIIFIILIIIAAILYTMVGSNHNSKSSDNTKNAYKANTISITGAGSTFIYPVMAKWTKQYEKESGTQINYQAIGSGGGIEQFRAKTIDFAASDEPLRIQELRKLNAIQFPAVISGIIPVINLKGIKNNQLILSGPVLADIYLGEISKWNDSKIQKLNPTLKLPNARIITIHRADGSGTTFNFTHYLTQVSHTWQHKVSYSTAVSWPGKLNIGGKGNAGVASQVHNIPNSIGYVEYAYAINNNMIQTRMINVNNKVINANLKSFQAAANNATWRSQNGFYQLLTNQPGANSWPIVATTFILMPNNKSYTTAQQKSVINTSIKFFKWSFEHGNNAAADLNYITMPKAVTNQVEQLWQQTYKVKA